MKRIDITLSLNSKASPTEAALVEYLAEHPTEAHNLMLETLEARFLAFVIAPTTPASKAIALQCVHKLEGYANAIREHHGLVLPRKPLGREVKR